jgi:tagatose 6-phosphate kinase
MILTVTLNAALDKTYLVSNFEPGGIYHVEEQHTSAGGKGINVARVAKTLGAEVMTTGFLGGQIGVYVEDLLARDGLDPHFVAIADETRLCTAIVDMARGAETKVNEQGPQVTEAEAQAFLERLSELASRAKFVALSGRLPLGIKPDFYADCILAVKQAGAWCGLDTHGACQNAALSRRNGLMPDLLKPNADELAEAVGGSIQTFQDAVRHTQRWVEQGADCLITFGEKGALLHTRQGLSIGTPSVVQYKSAVGSGDSAFGGYIWALGQGKTKEEAFRWAIAAGTANAETFGAASCTAEQIREQYKKTTTREYP